MSRTLVIVGGILVGLMVAALPAAAENMDVSVGWEVEEASAGYLRYAPETAIVWEGDTVTWRSGGHYPHTVTQWPPSAEGFDSSPMLGPANPDWDAVVAAWFGPGGFVMPGASFSHTFQTVGTIAYRCYIHPGMEAQVEVVAVTPGVTPATQHVQVGGGSGDTSIDRFTPAALTIPVGTTVVWTNVHADEPHTVSAQPADPDSPPGPENPQEFDSSPNLAMGPPPDWFEGPEGALSLNGAHTTFSHTFDEAGTYVYGCKLHGGMRGAVIVLEKAEPVVMTDDDDDTASDDEETSEAPLPSLLVTLVGLGALALVGGGRRGQA